jgi:hypothetical protein
MSTLKENAVGTPIGEAAGEVWRYLRSNGEATVARIARETALPRGDVERAIGWLAREGKLRMGEAKRREVISLQ